MTTSLYQYCNTCKTERNFKWIDSFHGECIECGFTFTAKVKEVVNFSSMKIEGGKNEHLSIKEAEELFDKITKREPLPVDPLEGVEKPFDVSGGVYAEKLKQGREIKHTPIDIKTTDFPTSVNLRIFMKGEDDE